MPWGVQEFNISTNEEGETGLLAMAVPVFDVSDSASKVPSPLGNQNQRYCCVSQAFLVERKAARETQIRRSQSTLSHIFNFALPLSIAHPGLILSFVFSLQEKGGRDSSRARPNSRNRGTAAATSPSVRGRSLRSLRDTGILLQNCFLPLGSGKR